MEEPKEILSQTINTVDNLLKDLHSCSITNEIGLLIKSKELFDTSKAKSIFAGLKEIKGRYIYTISFSNYKTGLDSIKKTYKLFDLSNKPKVPGLTYNVSKFNKSHNNQTLYVGTSKDLATRIRQHLGYGPKKTYSLHLVTWFPKDIDLTINIYKVQTNYHLTTELIEQTIWDNLKPIFGKRSGL